MPDMGGSDMPHDEGKTYEIPSDICPGMNVGDEMVLKIVGESDGKYQVSYAPAEGGEGSKSWEDEARATLSPRAKEQEAM